MMRSLNMPKLNLSLLLFPAVLIIRASSAQAATIAFDFRDATRTAESLVFEQDGLTVTATGFNSREDRLVHQSRWGLGVTAPGDSNTQIDGNPYAETLRLAFSEEIHLLGVEFEMMNGCGDDFSLRIDGSLVVDDHDPGNGWWLAPRWITRRAGNVIDLIADHKYDDFKVTGIKVSTWKAQPAIPEPSSALVFGLGLAVVAQAMRRRQA